MNKNHLRRDRFVRTVGSHFFWLAPLGLLAVVLLSVLGFSLGVAPPDHVGTAYLTSFFTWESAALLFTLAFAFTVVFGNVLTFRCASPAVALPLMLGTSAAGVIGITLFLVMRRVYLGPADLWFFIERTAFRARGVQTTASLLNGFAVWAVAVVVGASCAIIHHDDVTVEELSRQLRAAKLLLYVSAILLIVGVSAITALNKWPVYACKVDSAAGADKSAAPPDCPTGGPSLSESQLDGLANTAITQAGTLFTLLLAATYLPLAFALRQRAYRIVKPWEKTEAWLGVHGMALQPTQQLASIVVLLGPLLASGPVATLFSLWNKL